MSRTLTRDDIASLPVAERLRLISELWDSIPAEQVEVPEWHRTALDDALRDHEADPSGARLWSEVRDDLFPKKK